MVDLPTTYYTHPRLYHDLLAAYLRARTGAVILEV